MPSERCRAICDSVVMNGPSSGSAFSTMRRSKRGAVNEQYSGSTNSDAPSRWACSAK